VARKAKKAGASRKARPKPARRAKPKKRAKPAKGKPKARPPAVARPPKPKVGPPVRVARDEVEEETVCSIEFLSDNRSFIARLDTVKGGMREHKAPSFTDLLELVAEDLREEFLEA
jgi:hypothetical protein